MKIKCTGCNNFFDFVYHDSLLEEEVRLNLLNYNQPMDYPRGVCCPHCGQYVFFDLKSIVVNNEDAIMLTSAQIKELKDGYYGYGFSAGVLEGYTEAAEIEYDKGYEYGLADHQLEVANAEEEGQELYRSGVEEGYENGHQEGYTKGYDMGYSDGYIDCKSGRPPQS